MLVAHMIGSFFRAGSELRESELILIGRVEQVEELIFKAKAQRMQASFYLSKIASGCSV